MKYTFFVLYVFTVNTFSQDSATSSPLHFTFGATTGLNYEIYDGRILTFSRDICPLFNFGSSVGYEFGGVCRVMLGDPKSAIFGFGLRLLYQSNGTLTTTASDHGGCISDLIYDVKGDSLIRYGGSDKYTILKQHTLSYSSSRIVAEPNVIIAIVPSIQLSVGASISYSLKRNYKQTAELLTPGYKFVDYHRLPQITPTNAYWVVSDFDGYDKSTSSLTWMGLYLGINYNFTTGPTIVSPRASYTYGLSSDGLDGAPMNETLLSKLFIGCDILFQL